MLTFPVAGYELHVDDDPEMYEDLFPPPVPDIYLDR